MGAVDQELTQDQAIRVLLACRELFIDEELQENLAGLDAQCGGVMASWQPPWLEEGIEEMNFDEKMLREKPVEIWVAEFERVLQKLSRAAEQAELVSEAAFVVVIPAATDAAMPVIPTLVRLGGGMTLNEGSTSTLPFSRFIFLKSLEGWSNDPSAQRGLPWADFVKDAKLDPHDGDRPEQEEETLRSRALMAVLNATAATTLAEMATPQHQCVPQDALTQNESVSSAAPGVVAAGMLPPVVLLGLPSSIKFLHLGILQVATETHSEAAGLILAVMQLLREEEIWAKLIALDAYCDSLLSNWQPPWEEGSNEPPEVMTLERLRQEDESTVYDWAMALDGFCSFVANLAVAARIHHQVSSGEAATAELPAATVEDPDLEQSPLGGEAARCGSAALVVVVPDALTEWHLEVFGPLLRAFQIFMLSEKAWRADFNAASSVPFSVEAASVMGKPP